MTRYQCNNCGRDIPTWVNDIPKGYSIEGDIDELEHLISPDAHIFISFVDIVSVLSKDTANYILVGYGKTLTEAYHNEAPDGRTCRLVHIYFSPDAIYNAMTMYALNNFLTGIGKDVIYGYTLDRTIDNEVKLVMLFN